MLYGSQLFGGEQFAQHFATPPTMQHCFQGLVSHTLHDPQEQDESQLCTHGSPEAKSVLQRVSTPAQQAQSSSQPSLQSSSTPLQVSSGGKQKPQ